MMAIRANVGSLVRSTLIGLALVAFFSSLGQVWPPLAQAARETGRGSSGARAKKAEEPTLAILHAAEGKNGLVQLLLGFSERGPKGGILYPSRDMIFKVFSGDGPFEILEGPDGAAGYWQDDKTIAVDTNLGKDEWLDYVGRGGKVALAWDPGLAPKVANRYSANDGFNSYGTLNQFALRTRQEPERGRFVTTLEALPFDLAFHAWRDGDDLRLTVRFNRTMVGQEMVWKDCPEGDWPLSLSPNLATWGQWTGRSEFQFGSRDLDGKEYEAKVVGRQFVLSVAPGLKALSGEAMPAKVIPPLTPDPFRVLGFRQAGFEGRGRVLLELFFNKEVARTDLEKALRFLSVSGDDGQIEKPVQGIAIDGLGATDGERGLEAHLGGPLENGTRLRLRIKNLASADGETRIGSSYEDLMIENDLSVYDSGLRVEEAPPFRTYFYVEFHSALEDDGLEKYVELEPAIPFELRVDGDRLTIYAPFGRSEPSEVRLLAGLHGSRGVLEKDLSFTVRLPEQRTPMAAFTGQGRYLSPGLPMLVRLQGRESDALRLQAWRIYEDNLVAVLNLPRAGLGEIDKLRVGQTFSRRLFAREASLGDEPMDRFERLVDLEEILAGEGTGGEPRGKAQGIYILKATPLVVEKDGRKYTSGGGGPDHDYLNSWREAGDLYDWPDRYLPLVVTDLGISARVLPDSVSAWVVGLSTARPLAGALVTVYDSANQVLAQGQSGHDGLFRADLDASRATVLTAKMGDDLSYLILDGNARETFFRYSGGMGLDAGGGWRGLGGEGIGPGDSYLGKGHEAFIILPREIFKPGETIEAKALVRGQDMVPPREGFPLVYRLRDPRNQIISQARADLSPAGGLEMSVLIPFSGRTGEWILEVLVPEAREPLGTASFRVEDFVPPRLELTLASPEERLVGTGQTARLAGEARYLFGAKGAGLGWEMTARASVPRFAPPGFGGFVFGVDTYLSDFERNLGDQAGSLDKDGILDYRLPLSGDPLDLPPLIEIGFAWRVMEDGGRWNGTTASLLWFPRGTIVGLRPPRPLVAGRKLDFELVVLDADGAPADVGQLEVEVSRVIPRSYSTVRQGQIRSQKVNQLEEVLRVDVALTDGKGSFSIPSLESGSYEFLARGPSGETLRQRLMVGLESPPVVASSGGPVMGLSIKLDKPFYSPGEEALVRVEAPFDGPAWLTVETDELLYSGIGQVSGGILETRLPVPGGIVQNAHLTVSAVRPLAAGQEAFLAAGRVSLEMDRSPHVISVGTEIDGRLAPSSRASLKISLKDSQGRPLAGEATVALVDVGLLTLSGNPPVPDPLAYFGRSRYPRSLVYDLYDLLLPPEKPDLPFLAPGGGDEEADGLFSPFRRDQELLSLFLATVEVGGDGQAQVELDIPEYSGQARLAVVAASGSRFGQSSENITVNRDLTIEPTLPLALAPGDALVSTARIFLDPKAGTSAQASISIEAEGPLSIERIEDEDGRALALPVRPRLSPGQGRTIRIFLKAVPGEEEGASQVGQASLLFSASMGKESFTQRANTVVRPPYPWTSRSSGGQLKDAETILDLDFSGFLAGTAKASFALAAGPAVEAAKAAAFLRAYPYGCLEQTVSQAWAHLAALDLVALAGDDSEGGARMALEAAVRRLATMRTFSGGFAFWPGESSVYEWGSAYAAHFLIEASRRVELPPGLLEDAVGYARRLLANGTNGNGVAYDLAVRTYALYVLALYGESAYGHLNGLRDRQAGLSRSSLIMLASAEALMDGRPEALEELERDLPRLDKTPRGYYLESGSRDLALLLNAWALVDPQNPRTAGLAADVAAEGRKGHWSNTQENGMAILALANFMRRTGGAEPYRASISDLGGRLLASGGELDSLGLDSGTLADLPDRRLKISLHGSGRPWYSLTVSGVPTVPPVAGDNVISLRKTWTVGQDRFPLDDESVPLSVPRGEMVEVELVVSAAEATENVVVADLLPGGFEVAGLSGGGEDMDEGDYVDETLHLELREDRVIVVLPFLDGQHTFRYSLRAVTAGEFMLPPATAEGMYQPERRAVLPTSTVTVSE
ncbi:MAG: hypothetical protein LBP92_12465 [Deltaproteobacteria bacterium]|nr:hypothetical protein [Deltaproteobacteria bacterium]